jgi:tetratricopeptide (TPR) repeat protein
MNQDEKIAEAQRLHDQALKLDDLGDSRGALVALDAALAILDGPLLRRRAEFDPGRAQTYMAWGNVLADRGDLGGALKAYKAALALLDGPSLRDRAEFDPDRAKVQIDYGAVLADLGDLGGTLEACDAALALLDGPSLRGRAEFDHQRAKAQANRGAARADRGDLKGALEACDAALTLLDGINLRGRAELDSDRDRAATHVTRGNVLADLGDDGGALRAYYNALALFTGPLCRCSEVIPSLAKTYINCGRIFIDRNDIGKALKAYHAAEKLLEEPTTGQFLPLNVLRCELLAVASRLLKQLPAPHAWARQRSRRLAEMLELAPPAEDATVLWVRMRYSYAEFHANWLGHCLDENDAESLDAIPEVLAAIQGRDVAAEARDEQNGAVPGEPETVTHLREARRVLREIIGGPESPEASVRANAARDMLRQTREAARPEPGFALIAAPQTQVTADWLRNEALATDEALLLLVSHHVGGNRDAVFPVAVIIR